MIAAIDYGNTEIHRTPLLKDPSFLFINPSGVQGPRRVRA